jgi:Pyridoxamine 5'-phosphate oxidase
MQWQAFAADAPELSRLILDRFESTDLVMLGTIRKNGWPRISPIEYTIYEGELMLGGMWQSKKLLDLLRDPRCTIHSTTANKDGQEGDAKLYGRATPLAPEREEGYWQHIFDTTGWRAEGPAHVFTVDVISAGYIVFDGEGTMRWLTWPNGDWRTQRSS